MSLNRDTWKINRRPKQIESFDLKQSYRPRKEKTAQLGVNVNPTKEKRIAKKDDVVRYNGRICKITYVHSDKTVNLTAHKGAPFNSQHTPIVDLEFANEDGSFAVMDVEPEITVITPPAPVRPKLEIKPKVAGDQTIIFPMSEIEARAIVTQIRANVKSLGEKLLQLYEREGWKALGYKNWRECIDGEFDFQKTHAYELLGFARVERNLSAIAENVPMPTAESQVRRLTGLSAEQQRAAWTSAVEANNGEVPTAKQVEHAADQIETSPQNLNVIELSREDMTLPISTSQGRQKPKSNVKGAGRDQCQTPSYGLIPLIPYLLSSWTVWEPAAGKGRLVEALVPHVAKVNPSDILTGDDFLKSDRADFDAIITNPPYSTKYDWLKRCYEIGKPFALLMPGESLFAESGQVLFEQYGLELITYYPRVDFEMPNMGFDGDGSTFPTAWFTWGLNIGQPITRVDIGKEKTAFKDSLKQSI